jgi:hypothetical protein
MKPLNISKTTDRYQKEKPALKSKHFEFMINTILQNTHTHILQTNEQPTTQD